MKRIARKKGNIESTRDIKYITIIGVLCFLAFCVQFIGFLITTILFATKTITDKNRTSTESLYTCVTASILFVAYSILIQIFWQYVININEAMS